MWWVFRTTKDGEKRQRCFDDRDMMVAVGPDGRMDSRAAEKCDFFLQGRKWRKKTDRIRRAR